MEGRRFDAWTRALAGGRSRRAVLRALVGAGGVAALGPGTVGGVAAVGRDAVEVVLPTLCVDFCKKDGDFCKKYCASLGVSPNMIAFTCPPKTEPGHGCSSACACGKASPVARGDLREAAELCRTFKREAKEWCDGFGGRLSVRCTPREWVFNRACAA